MSPWSARPFSAAYWTFLWLQCCGLAHQRDVRLFQRFIRWAFPSIHLPPRYLTQLYALLGAGSSLTVLVDTIGLSRNGVCFVFLFDIRHCVGLEESCCTVYRFAIACIRLYQSWILSACPWRNLWVWIGCVAGLPSR